MNINSSTIPNQRVQEQSSDEIDLRELILVLWRHKILILLVTGVFSLAGIAYALLAQQVWSANAVIEMPHNDDLLPMLRVASQAKQLGMTNFPDGKSLYDEFVSEFNSYNNRRSFLKETPLFRDKVKADKLDERKQRLWMREWSKYIAANAADRKENNSAIALMLSAETPEQALSMLENYIQYIIVKQQKALKADLKEQQSIMLDALMVKAKLLKEDAEQDLNREIKDTVVAIAIANTAGVDQPLENYRDSGRFPITLGAKGLEEKLKMLKAIDLTFYRPELLDIQARVDRLKQVKFDEVSFRPFSYLDEPEENSSRDKPKRPLIVVLATLLGGMLGVAIVLVRHAFRRPEAA